MLTRTSEYALRALIYVARHLDDQPIPGRQIAREAGVPEKYLSKILRDLVREGVLVSSRGRTGGFEIARPARTIRLSEVLTPFEPVLTAERPCPFGKGVCCDGDPCPGHDGWERVRDSYYAYLSRTSLYDVAIKRSGKRKKKGKSR